MKILHVNYHQTQGGASVAVNRLVKALNSNNVESELLVNEKKVNDIYATPQFKNLFSLYFHKIKKIFSIYLKKLLGANDIYKDSISIFPSKLHNTINNSKADIINLHWICNEMISLKEINKINKPIVWTLLDMWPFAGSTHYTENDFYKFHNKKFDEKKIFNIENWVLNRKKKYFSNDIVVICVSKWLERLVKQSYIFKDNKIFTVPLAIDANEWKSIGKISARKIINFNEDKKYFLFSAFNGIGDKRKGFDLLLEAVSKIDLNIKDFEIVILGNSEGLEEIKNKYEYNFRTFDKKKPVNNYDLIKTIYSACDILIMPSRLECLGQVPLEAGGCSLPCVSFKDTGVEDIINHKEDGYLAEYLNTDDLANGINLLCNETINNKMSKNIRNKIAQEFSYEKISKKYKDIYKTLT